MSRRRSSRWIVALLICFIGTSLHAQSAWHTRASVEFPFWTAAVRSGEVSQYVGGYGFEVGVERDVWRRGRVGAALIGMRRLAPNAVACYTGDTGGVDDCGNLLGRSSGAFATLRQHILHSSSGAYLAATLGAGVFEFDGDYLGRRMQGSGPAAMYGADAITPAIWDVAIMASIRAQLAVAVGDKPLHVTTATIGFRVRP